MKITVTETVECGTLRSARTVEIEPTPEIINHEPAIDLKKVARMLHELLDDAKYQQHPIQP